MFMFCMEGSKIGWLETGHWGFMIDTPSSSSSVGVFVCNSSMFIDGVEIDGRV